MAGGRTGRNGTGQDTTGRDAAAPPHAAESRCSGSSGRPTQAPPFLTAAPRRRVPPGPPPPPPLRIRGAGPSPSRPSPRPGAARPPAGVGSAAVEEGRLCRGGRRARSCPAVSVAPSGAPGTPAPLPAGCALSASGVGSGQGATIGRGGG